MTTPATSLNSGFTAHDLNKLEKFRALVRHAYAHAPYYSRLIAELGIDIARAADRIGRSANISSGSVDVGRRKYTLRVEGRYDVDELEGVLGDVLALRDDERDHVRDHRRTDERDHRDDSCTPGYDCPDDEEDEDDGDSLASILAMYVLTTPFWLPSGLMGDWPTPPSARVCSTARRAASKAPA